MKKITCFILTLAIIFSFSTNIFADTVSVDTKVYFEDTELIFENPVYNIDGRTFFPMRELLNNLGVSDDNIIWYPSMKVVSFYANNVISMYEINSNVRIINGESSEIDAMPVIIDGSTYLPIRYVADGCGYTVNFDEATMSIHIE